MARDEPLLEVQDLNGYYGTAHVLQDVSFQIGSEPTGIIGRNGMGKTTLCLALMGLLPTARGSVRFHGQELLGKPAYKIAAAGLGLVPQGRRLFPSLTTEEHLRLVAGRRNGGGWTIERVYELFPRLAKRRRAGGMELSGGEQQMLAIARTLLLDPKLLARTHQRHGIGAIRSTQREAVGQLGEDGEQRGHEAHTEITLVPARFRRSSSTS